MHENITAQPQEAPVASEQGGLPEKYKTFTVESHEGEKIELIAFAHHQKLPVELPKGYCYMGGVARTIVLKEFGEEAMEPRDLDAIAIKEFKPDISEEKLDEWSKKIMPRDTEYGNGIKVEDIGYYFSRKDYT